MPHTGTVIWMLIGFLTVFFLLKKFAWKPVLNALKQRESTIENALRAADAAKKDMERLNRYLRAWRYLTRDEPM